MKALRVGLFGVIFVLLAACASSPLAVPTTFQGRVDYADSTLTAVVNATTVSLSAGQLSVNEAKSVRDIAEQARTLLDAARAASGTPVGDQNLTLAIGVLQNIQTYLNKRNPG